MIKSIKWDGMGSSPVIDGEEVKDVSSFTYSVEVDSIPQLTITKNVYPVHEVEFQTEAKLLYDTTTIHDAFKVLRTTVKNDTHFRQSMKDTIKSSINDFYEGLPFTDVDELSESILARLFLS